MATTTQLEQQHKADLLAKKLKPYEKWLIAHKFGIKAAADKNGVSPSTMLAALDKLITKDTDRIDPKFGVPDTVAGHDSRRWSLIQNYVTTHPIASLSADEIAYGCMVHVRSLCHDAGTQPFDVSPACIIAACEAKHLPIPTTLKPPPGSLI